MTVYLVGAGPGDPGLFTRRGAALLEAADVVVYDRLGTAALMSMARADAVLIDVGKAPGRAAMTQDQINSTLVEQGRAHDIVVRLKGGDRLRGTALAENHHDCIAGHDAAADEDQN